MFTYKIINQPPDNPDISGPAEVHGLGVPPFASAWVHIDERFDSGLATQVMWVAT